MAAGDKVMIATLDRSLVVRRGFDATGPLDADLAKIAKHAPGGIHTEVERRLTMSQIRDLYADRGCEAVGEMQALAASWTQDVDRQTRATLSTLQALLESLGGRSGRKALLYVTEGLPLNPGLEAQLLIGELCGGNPDPSTGLVGPLERVSRAANAAQVTLYTLDAGGQRVLASAESAGPGLALANQANVRSDSQDPAFALATDTGGKALLESNRPELLLADLAQDLTAYYSIAFTPRPGDAGRAHHIRVEVKRPGVRVRHRSSWDPATPEDQLNGRVLAALHFGGEDANPLQARLEAGPPHREADGSFTVVSAAATAGERPHPDTAGCAPPGQPARAAGGGGRRRPHHPRPRPAAARGPPRPRRGAGRRRHRATRGPPQAAAGAQHHRPGGARRGGPGDQRGAAAGDRGRRRVAGAAIAVPTAVSASAHPARVPRDAK